jgi:myosin heavy subunit
LVKEPLILMFDPDHMGSDVNDMISMNEMNDATILANLRNRYGQLKIYVI